jgi:hypothetical protein
MNNRDIQIKNAAGWFQRAGARILSRAGCGAVQVAQQAVTRKLPASRLDLLFIKGPSSEQPLNDQGDLYADDTAGRFIITISTKREQAQPVLIEGVQTFHEEMAARVGAALDFKENPFEGMLPFYQVNQIDEAGHDRDLDLNFWMDYTRIPFDLRFTTFPNSWSLPDSALAAFGAANAP